MTSTQARTGPTPPELDAIPPVSPWHTESPDDVAEALSTGRRGLREDEAAQRLARDGPNELPEQAPTSALLVLRHQFRSPLIYILVAAALVTLALNEYIDAAVIAAVLALNALIGYTQERRAENSVRALMRLMSPRARIVRGGREREIESRELVRGDVVLLESGVRVPADLRLFSTTALRVDESLLTGESLPVTKTAGALGVPDLPLADRTNMAYTATVVASGRGQGLPVAFTITLALGVRRMARRQAIVRRLPAVETLGSTTVIGSDKTGTLTENRMSVMVVFQMFHVGSCRSQHRSVFAKSPLSNPFLFLATAAALLIHVGALYFGPTQLVLRVEPIDAETWMRIAMTAASIIAAVEMHKLVRKPRLDAGATA